MISLGLDPSLRSFGWAIVDTSAKNQARRIASGHESTTASDCQPARYLHLQDLVRNLLTKYTNIEVVGIESPAYQAGPFQSIHHSLMMFSLAEIFMLRKDCVLFDPSTREYLIRNGKRGKLNKLDVQRFVQMDTMDPSQIQNDEADAYVIGLFAARLMELKQGIINPEHLTQAETQKFIQMTRRKKTLNGVKTVRTAHAFRENNRFFNFSKVPPGSTTLPKKGRINPVIEDFIQKSELGDDSDLIAVCSDPEKCYESECPYEPIQWVENTSGSVPITIAMCKTHSMSMVDLKSHHLIDRTKNFR